MANSRDLQLVISMRDEMSKSLKGIGKTILSVFAVRELYSFAKASVEMAAASQMANEKLAAALSNVRGARAGDLEMLQQQASALQKVTAIEDDEIINNQALLASFQLNGEAIASLIPRILDMGAANAQTGELTADLHSATMAIGKAMTGGLGVLSRYGVAMTDAQKNAFDLGNEQQKLTVLTQVLDDNFKNAAETIGNTFRGRVERAKNSLGDLREELGFALMPALEMLTDEIYNATEQVKGNQERVELWGEAFYLIASVIKGVISVIWALTVTVFDFGSSIVDLGKLVFAVVKDIWGIWRNLFTNLKLGLSAMMKIFQGDFEGAAKDIQSAVSASFSNTRRELNNFGLYTKESANFVGGAWDKVAENFNEAFTQKGYKPVTQAAVTAYREMNDGAKSTAGALDPLTEDLSKLKDKYLDLEENAEEALSSLASEHKENLSKIRADIKQTEKAISDLQKSFETEQQGDIKSVAEKVVETEQKIADLKQRIAEETNYQKKQGLQKELFAEQNALNANADFFSTIENQILEARRRTGLTDLERVIEDYTAKRVMAQAEFNEKMTTLQAELEAHKNKEKQEVEMYATKVLALQSLQQAMLEAHKAFKEREFAITKQGIQDEIKMYEQLANAISKVKGGQSVSLAEFSSAVGGMTSGVSSIEVNISGNTINGDVGIKEMAEKVGSAILDKLKMNQRLAF